MKRRVTNSYYGEPRNCCVTQTPYLKEPRKVTSSHLVSFSTKYLAAKGLGEICWRPCRLKVNAITFTRPIVLLIVFDWLDRNHRKGCPSGMVFLQILQTVRFAAGLQRVHHSVHGRLLAGNAGIATQFQIHSGPSEGNGSWIVSI